MQATTGAPVSRLLAYLDGWTASEAYDQRASGRSEPLMLRAGQPVLLELTVANWAGQGYAQVAVVVPSSSYR